MISSILNKIILRASQRLYEAAQKSRLRRKTSAVDSGSADYQTLLAGMSLLQQARYLHQNYDMAVGVVDDLTDKIVGRGIRTKPTAKDKKGQLHAAFNADVKRLLKMHAARPETTWELTERQSQVLECQTWLRDGEIFVRAVYQGEHGTEIPLSFEHIEADQVPHDLNKSLDNGNRIIQGVEKTPWGRPVAYHFYVQHPSDVDNGKPDIVRVPAEFVFHCKLTTRPRQTRGVTVFASVINRLLDIKDYDESENSAARLNAAMVFQILRDVSMSAAPATEDDRDFKVAPGMVWTDLLPGEKAEMIKADRPNPNLETYRQSQIRAVAAGTGASFSSIAKNYDGSYSSRRQERIEHNAHISRLREDFVDQLVHPKYVSVVEAGLLAGLLKRYPDLDPDTIFDAEHRGPGLEQIDPEREANAALIMARAGFMSRSQVILQRGEDPEEVREDISAERRRDTQSDLVFNSNYAWDTDTGNANAQ